MSSPTDHPNPSADALEVRLEALVEQCTTALGRAALEGERAERALARIEAQLRDGEGAAARAERDAAQRLHDLERLVRQEWSALRDLHEEPLRELRQQAQQLTEVSLAAAHQAQQGADAAAARLAAIEARIEQRFADLSREVRDAVAAIEAVDRVPVAPIAEVVPPSEPARVLPLRVVPSPEPEPEFLPEPVADPASAPEPDPVAELAPAADAEPAVAEPAHTEPAVESITNPVSAAIAEPVAELPVTPVVEPVAVARAAAREQQVVELSARVRELERTLEERQDDTWRAAEQARRATRGSRLIMGVLAVVVIVALGVTLVMQMSMRRRIEAATAAGVSEANAAEQRAGDEAAQARAAAAREAAASKALAARTERMSAVLVAPDLVRRALYGTTAGSLSVAQVFWSRTQGVVVSASKLPAAPDGSTYQVWVLSNGNPMSAGTLTPDADGDALLVADPPTLTSPFLGVVVTQEPAGGSPKPTGRLVLARYPTQPE